jgi:hypothetical protein
MRLIGAGKGGVAKRRAWQPPAVTKLAIGARTKSVHDDVSRAGASASPPQPASPVTKLGFYFELAFPLSARYEQ